MFGRKYCLIWAVALVGVFASAESAEAIPAFARRYGVSCTLCHNPAPRLTAFGEQFAANGFQMAVGEAPRDTIATGDPLLTLVDKLDFAVRLDAYLTAGEPFGSDEARLDLQTPYNIKVLAGGAIAEKISYYFYFFLGERGEVAGLEDAYVQFSDLLGSGVALMVGQFQISDPMFKRELRLPVEDYQLYRVRVGEVRADLTYDRGLYATYDPWERAALSLMLVNGSGLRAAESDRMFDQDPFKSFAAHLSQELGPLRVGGFGYYGNERAEGHRDRILVYGPDATLTLGGTTEVNVQFLRREDTNPFLSEGSRESHVATFLGEVVLGPYGSDGRWFGSLLYNWIDADQPVVSLRLGEQEEGDGFLSEYQSIAAAGHYLLRRNIRLVGEVGWDLEREVPRLTIGSTLAW